MTPRTSEKNWAPMFRFECQPAKQLLTLHFAGHVTAGEIAQGFAAVLPCLQELRPGFRVLTDLTELRSMDVECAAGLGTWMERFAQYGVGTVVRVIPDPQLDIGFDILSRFHYGPDVGFETCETLEDARRALEK